MVGMEELHKLRIKIPDEELQRAKNILNANILMAMERREDRLEEVARCYMTYKHLTFLEYVNNINKVTSESINRVATKALQGIPTLLVSAPDLKGVPTA